MKDGGADGGFHAGLAWEVDVQLGRGQAKVRHKLRRQHSLKKSEPYVSKQGKKLEYKTGQLLQYEMQTDV